MDIRRFDAYLPTAHHSPLTTHHSPLTTHHSPLTTHHSPLTTHHSPPTTHDTPLTGPPTTHHPPPTTHHPTDAELGLEGDDIGPCPTLPNFELSPSNVETPHRLHYDRVSSDSPDGDGFTDPRCAAVVRGGGARRWWVTVASGAWR